MFHRSAFPLPVEIDDALDEQIDKAIDRILVLAMQYEWNPRSRLASIHRSIKAWHLYYWDGATEWVREFRIDRDLQGLACALRKAIPGIHATSRGVYAAYSRHDNPIHYFGKSGMEELRAALERNLAQDMIDTDNVVTTSGVVVDADVVVTTSGVIVDLFAALYGHAGTIDLDSSPDQDAQSPGTPLSGKPLESRCSLGGELCPNG